MLSETTIYYRYLEPNGDIALHNNSIFGTSYNIAIAVSEQLASLMIHHVKLLYLHNFTPSVL